MGVAPAENPSIYDGLLTFGLIWLDRARRSSRARSWAGLRLYFPEGTGRATAHRLSALSATVAVQLYEYNDQSGRARSIDRLDIGNVESWLAQRRETEAALGAAGLFLDRVRRHAPDAIQAQVAPGTSHLDVRYRGLSFARWQPDAIFFGVGDPQKQKLLSANREPEFEKLLKELETYRSPLASGTTHALYRAQPERWLEPMIAADPVRVDARLDPRFVYCRSPMRFRSGDRGVMDLVGVTRDGRLVVLELKAQGRHSHDASGGGLLAFARPLAPRASGVFALRIFPRRRARSTSPAFAAHCALAAFSSDDGYHSSLSGPAD